MKRSEVIERLKAGEQMEYLRGEQRYSIGGDTVNYTTGAALVLQGRVSEAGWRADNELLFYKWKEEAK